MKMRINYSKVISQADSISENAQDLSKCVEQIEQIEQSVKSAWQGEAADTFLDKLRQLKDEMRKTGKSVNQLSETIRYCANRIKREDEEAERRANALKSKS